jgi:hypothetical protein
VLELSRGVEDHLFADHQLLLVSIYQQEVTAEVRMAYHWLFHVILLEGGDSLLRLTCAHQFINIKFKFKPKPILIWVYSPRRIVFNDDG